MKKIKILLLVAILGLNACGNWIDVVPDGVATIDMAFNSRVQTLKYLATCYSYMPQNGNVNADPAMLGGDELWTIDRADKRISRNGLYIAQGMQNVTNPIFESWGILYRALRDCNIFLDNVEKVPDLPDWERDQWIAEVKVLKAYYHFYLVQMYGPIPIIRENLPMSVDVNAVKTLRDPVDECFQYIVELLDEATAGDMLPLNVLDVAGELGRITKPIALALKAKILVTAASPLFNGNDQQATLLNRDGTQLFNTTYDNTKWQKAMVACKEAIETCHEAGIELYEYPNTGITRLTDTIAIQMSLRNAFTLRWNSEIIWANTQSISTGGNEGLHQFSMPRLNPAMSDSPLFRTELAIPLNIANMFYTHHGVPLEDDKTVEINNIYDLRLALPIDKLYVRAGSTTVNIHFDREPRFYAWVGFDCGIWYGQGRIDDQSELWHFACKNGDIDGYRGGIGAVTGYLPKKHIPYTNVLTALSSYSYTPYPWPIMRLSDLYLLYAEAINEAEGPDGVNSVALFEYLDRVRARAGLDKVKESWDQYANTPKYNNQTGMRQIIQQERMIELSFEGHRFWDVRRWKTAPDLYRIPVEGWNMQEWETASFYISRVLDSRKFGIRDYFWPIRNSDLISNPNLVQNIGW